MSIIRIFVTYFRKTEKEAGLFMGTKYFIYKSFWWIQMEVIFFRDNNYLLFLSFPIYWLVEFCNVSTGANSDALLIHATIASVSVTVMFWFGRKFMHVAFFQPRHMDSNATWTTSQVSIAIVISYQENHPLACYPIKFRYAILSYNLFVC